MRFQIFVFLFFTIFQSCSSQKVGAESISKISEVNYENSVFSFRVSVPKNWKVYKEVENDTVNKSAFINWGIPKVYSEIEKTEIENSVFIKAFKNESIKNIEDLILNEYLRIDPTKTMLKIDKGIGEDARIVYHTDSNGLEYKGKSYFKFNNGISYIITFMATPGTFETNLELFEKFYLTLIIK